VCEQRHVMLDCSGAGTDVGDWMQMNCHPG
jgi:hypothetical protein